MNPRSRELPPPQAFTPIAAAPVEARSPDPDILLELERFAASARALENLELLSSGRALLVIAGQQPSFPLPLGLTLMKTATAVMLARRESERLGVPVLPLFWNGSDDSDFEEAAGQVLPRSGKTPLEISLPRQLHIRGRQVGDLVPDHAFAELGRFASTTFAPNAGEDLGDFHARVLAAFFEEDGLLVLDARAPAICRAALPIYGRYIERRRKLSACVDRAGDKLETESGDRPLRRKIGLRALFFLKEGRRRLPSEKDYEDALTRRLESDDPALAPNVLLRPMVQDSLFPVTAVVLGPSEWRYHLQIQAAFDLMDVPFPRPFPRLDALDDHELRREWPPPGGRRHSPLLEAGSRLAERRTLLDLAQVHLEAWENNLYYQWIMEGPEKR